MLVNSDYEFALFISQANYSSKPEKAEMSKMRFTPQQLTIKSALECATQGKAFCYTFSTNNQNGVLSIKDKKKENFISTSIIIYDFDDMPISMVDYINSLYFKPSFAYPTYSNGKNGLSRYRLAFVLDTEIYGENNFNAIYHAIANANQFVKETKEQGGWDVRSVAQMYYGTTPNVETYISNIVYSISDFSGCIVATSSSKAKHSKRDVNLNDNKTPIDERFLSSLYKYSYGKFFRIYFESYYSNYTHSLETKLKLSDNGMWYEYPDDYVAVMRKRQGKYVQKWQAGEDRKKKLYITSQIMLYNCPELTIENLIYNLVIEREWYYDNEDDKLNNQVLIQTAINAFNKRIPLKTSEHPSYRVNKDFWSEQGITTHQAKGYIKREKNLKEILPYIDRDKTIKENYNVLKDKGFSLSLRTLQRMVARGDIEIIKDFSSTTLLSECRNDATNHQSQILELIRSNNKITTTEIAKQLDCDASTVKRCIKKMKGCVIDREGNNRTGHWIILEEPKPITKQTTEPDCSTDYYLFEKNFEEGSTKLKEPQLQSDDELISYMRNEGYTAEMIEDFLSIYA